MTVRDGRRPPRRLRLPVVRVRPLPPEGGGPRWEEGPDWPAVAAVAVVGVVGAALAAATLVRELGAETPQAPVLAGIVLLGLACVAASVLALAEGLHRERIVLRDGALEVSRRGLGGSLRWREPLAAYQGLVAIDRQRRLFVRNQDRPPTGRRGPVTEFVVVLRHGDDPARDLELFRAQPSLETLRTMHVMSVSRAGRGDADARAAACEERARGYRDALCRIARELGVQVLVVSREDPVPRAVDAERLGVWLEAEERGDGERLPA